MYARVRDIEDGEGACLRICLAPHPSGALVTLERRDNPDRPAILLCLYGAEILSGFIMAARLSAPWPMPDETVEGNFSIRLHLDCGSPVQLWIEQDGGAPLTIGTLLWDRLYAELCLTLAHGRELARLAQASLH